MNDLWRPRVLREYSFVADGERGALLGPDGAIVWMCAPRWDSAAVFSALLGGQGGYAVAPADPWHVWGGYYEPASLIWRSRWVGTGIVECREALAMPADPHRAVILRRIEACAGPARVSVVLDVRAGFGRSPMRDLATERGVWTGRSGASPRSGSVWFRWSGAAKARPDRDGRLRMTLTVPPGQHHDLVLEISDRPLGEPLAGAGDAWAATEDAWAGAVPACDGLVAARDASHAHAVLRGLTSASGGMVAAATTSMPERLEGVRNYDYRYAWIRDQCYAGIAMAAHGALDQLSATVRFITERVLADGPDLRPAYTAHGEPIPDERSLRLRGYPGSSVRIGNRVRKQFQLDSLGEILQLLAAAAEQGVLDADGIRAAEVAASAIEQRWPDPDAGIWELHDDALDALQAVLRGWAAGGCHRDRGSFRAWRGVAGWRRHAARCPVEQPGRRDHGGHEPGAASDRPLEPGRRRRSCRRGSAARRCCAVRCRPTTRDRWPRSPPSQPNSLTTVSSIASGTTTGRSMRQRAPSCFAASGWR